MPGEEYYMFVCVRRRMLRVRICQAKDNICYIHTVQSRYNVSMLVMLTET